MAPAGAYSRHRTWEAGGEISHSKGEISRARRSLAGPMAV